MKRAFIIIGLLFLLHAQAEDKVYKSVDEKGNVIFSDVPTENSKEITISPTSTYKAPSVSTSLPGKQTTFLNQDVSYESLTITSPPNDKVYFNEEANLISVSVAAEPAKRPGHKLVLKVNGAAQSELSLKQLPRGSYTLVAELQDSGGESLITSEAVQIHIKRNFIKRN